MPGEPPLTDAAWRRTFRRRLRNWYDRAARDLPWRRTNNAYHIWVSEIMLQQTQVATVIPYFERFLKAFPSVAQLANADEQTVLRYWEGLGYYRRARQMHAAAKRIVAEHRGKIPREVDLLRDLPGIGPYTAGAILSIAFGAREPILEANTIRLVARLLAITEDVGSTKIQNLMWSFSDQLLPRKEVGLFNQALMELGSLICTPKFPSCDACPVADLCMANAKKLQQQLPVLKQKISFEKVNEAAVVIRHRGRILIRQCGSKERWEGLWDFPRVPVTSIDKRPMGNELVRGVCELTGLKVRVGPHLMTIKHGVTRFRITLHCFTAELVSPRSDKTAQTETRWIKPGELVQVPLSSSARKLAERLESKETILRSRRKQTAH